ncbi:PAS domain S-box protein [Flammeovirga yaeyamensis]|uniref:histidine kinase n=1 Tax=Flammeovirga yaeyamensis TaxID=367791 RepID=A0AAX1N3I8_9BACT|nr:PAS domain S-box protein [Flammeovirga yaeyamensis]MBB3696109.1 PAS domain S-box-containing protein [Flammeovirga yaeyamensis]NMF34794.1 PAS domain S-box protein [Flammeovirga yaeyamensis]QWG00378.1 PAS domain S-box protein [Flammeovirga yaeyamensis]
MQAFIQNRNIPKADIKDKEEHYLVISGTGNVKFISKRFLQGQHTFEEGRSIAVGLSPKNQIIFKQKIQESIDSQDIVYFEFSISQSGKPTKYDVKITPFFIGEVFVNASFVAQNNDQELLEKRFKDIYLHSHDGIIWIDPFDKKIIYSNPSFSKITGYDEKECLNSIFKKFLPLKKQQLVKSIFERLKKEKHLVFEVSIKTIDNIQVPVEITASIVSTDDDAPFIVCFIKDLTALIKAKEALKNNEQRYEAILDNSKIKLCQFDVDLNLTWVGSGIQRQLSSFLSETHIGKKISTIVSNDVGKDIVSFQKEVLDNKSTSHASFKIQYDQEWKAVEVFLSPILENKKVKGLNAVILNISNQNKIEEKLDHFVYRAAHDLRGPLTTIQGIIQLMKSSPKSSKELLPHLEHTIWTQDMHLQKILAYYYNQQTDIKIGKVNWEGIMSVIDDFLNHSGYNIKLSILNDMKNEDYFSDATRIDLLFKNICTTLLQLVTRDIEIKLLIEIKKEKSGVMVVFTDNISPRDYSASNNGFDKSMSINFINDDYTRGLFITSEIIEKLKGKYQVKFSKNKKQQLEIFLPSI